MRERLTLASSSALRLQKNFEGSRTQGRGPPSNNMSLDDPRVTTATDTGSTACRNNTKYAARRFYKPINRILVKNVSLSIEKLNLVL